MIYFTDFFNIKEDVLEKYGAFNISLRGDMPLFIDPFLLFYSDKQEYKKLHNEIIKYLIFLKEKAQLDLNESQFKSWFMFPEQKQNWLGYSCGGNIGSGLGRKFANNLKYALKTNFSDFGCEHISKGTHLEMLCLINEGVGKDNISDFTVNLIKSFLLEYTEKFAKLYLKPEQCNNFWIQKDSFDYDLEIWKRKQYYLPSYNGDYVILTPRDILTRDTSWINREDMYKKFETLPLSIENDVLRMQINQYFNSQLAIVGKREPTKEEKNKAILSTIKEYPIILDYYIKAKEEDGENAVTSSQNKVSNTEQILISNTKCLIQYLQTTNFYKEETQDAYQEAKRRVQHLKEAIEDNDCYKLLYNGDGKTATEKELQLMYRLVCCGSEYDVNSEVNNGRGPVDYKISKGAKDSALIEFKLAQNTKIKQNLKNQVDVYKKANKTEKAITVIVYFSEKEYNKVILILKELGLEENENIVLIDARKDNKISASNVK